MDSEVDSVDRLLTWLFSFMAWAIISGSPSSCSPTDRTDDSSEAKSSTSCSLMWAGREGAEVVMVMGGGGDGDSNGDGDGGGGGGDGNGWR